MQPGVDRRAASTPSAATDPELRRRRGRLGPPRRLLLLVQSLLGTGMLGSSALAQAPDAGAAHASLGTTEPGTPTGAVEVREAPLAPGAGLLKRIENPALLSERVIAERQQRAGIDPLPVRAAAEPARARVVERSPVPMAASADEQRAERQRRTRAFETEAGVTVLSNRNADAPSAPPARTRDLPSPVTERPTGETVLDPPRLTSTHSLRPLSAAQSERNALGVGLPLLLLLGASTLAGALWWQKKSQT